MILVTGGTGFIGSNLVGRLADEGTPVCVCDTQGPGQKWRNIGRHDVDVIVPPFELADFLERRGDDIDFVYHLGAISSTTDTDLEKLSATNVRLPQSIWRWCTRRGVPLVYASSAATYGDGSHGFSDADDVASLEKLSPLNPYARSKWEFDLWVASEVSAGSETPPSWYGLKFFNVYGPNEYHKGDMRSMVARAYPAVVAGEPVELFRSHSPDYADGGQMRDFVYVRDCVDVMIWLHDARPKSGIYNVGTGRAQSWLELMTALHAAVDRPLAVRWIDPPEEIRARYQYFTEADMTKLRTAGYERPFAPVEEGVHEYVERYLSKDDPYR